MHIMSIALGGCIRGEPVPYGITEDTGGHIAYLLGEMRALAAHPHVDCAEIVTRLFHDKKLGAAHGQRTEVIAPGFRITRIDSGNRKYLAKEELRADRKAFVDALIADLRSRDRLPDLLHAHFADAADVAARIKAELGIPYIYTAHSLGIDKRSVLNVACAELEARIEEEDRAIAGAAAVIGSSRDECERQLPAYPSADFSKFHRVVPGVCREVAGESDIRAAARLISPFLRDPAKPILLAISRPVHKKNLPALVEAFAPLRDKANLVILAGQRTASNEGEAEQVSVVSDLLHLIDRHDLYGSVAYPKTHTSAHVSGLYALAAGSRGVFVNPALMEPYGLTVVEAAVHGLPVVATKIGGPLDTVWELGHGEVVDPTDQAELTSAIARLLDDPTHWFECSRNGVCNSRDHTWASYAKAFVKIAGGILGAGSRVEARPGPAVTSLFVSDLDNTLTGCSEGIGQLRRFLAENRHFAFAIATGRSIIEARRLVREWDIPEPTAWITSVGSEIYWSTGHGPAREKDYPALGKVRWTPEAVEKIVARVPSLKPQAAYEQRDFKRSYFFLDAADVGVLREALLEAGLAVRVIASHDRLLDILPVSAGKAAAMRYVGASLGIADERIFAAGDSGNDEDMLAACENAIIVKNHSSEITALTRRPNVHLSRHAHAAGVLDGIDAHLVRRGWKAPRVTRERRA